MRSRAAALAFACAWLGAASAPAAEHAPAGLGFPLGFGSVSGAARCAMEGRSGDAWLRCRTDGSGAYALARNRQPLVVPIDARGRFLKVRLRVEAPGHLGGMELRLGSSRPGSDYFAFGVPLFSDPEFQVLQPGEWKTLTFSFGAARRVGRPDRARLRWLTLVLRDDGGAPTDVAWAGLTLVDEPSKGRVSLTFDDGYDEHHDVAAARMARFDFRGTAYVIPDVVDTEGYMTRAQLRALRDRFGWEVAAHHAIPFTTFDGPDLEAAIAGVQRYLVEHGFDTGQHHLAYPLGKHDVGTVLPIARRYFRSARLAGGGPETLPPGDWHALRVMNVLSTTTPEEVEAAVRSAREHRHWLILMFHFLVEGKPTVETEYRIADFERVLEKIHASEVAVVPVGELLPMRF